ncbi:MAG: STAS domain-containing protein [Treponema sp.]|nr:STAS domain-containing protein [Treponema sp.]
MALRGGGLISFRDFIPRTFEFLLKKEPYSPRSLGKDCIAGLTVGVVALPLAMAFSIAAGGSPAQGLYTAILAGFFISLLGGSRYQIGGPTGAFVVIIFGVISRHGMEGLVMATLLAGIMLVIMGFSGLGRLVKFIPYPVTAGFTAGIALIIFSQQIKDFFGLTIEAASPEFIAIWAGYLKAMPGFRGAALGIGLGTIGVILLVRRFIPRIPGPVAGVAAATALCAALGLPVDTIGSRFGGIPQSLPRLALPVFHWNLIRDVLQDSFTIALLAAIESLLSAVVADGMTGDRHKANMELVGQGVGNMAAALFGGIPATGAIARTATNIKAGAVSPVAGIIHALTLVLFILFLAPLASAIPLASLSAVLIVVAWDMSNVQRFIRILFRSPKSDALVLVTTFALTVLVDLTFAVEAGVILAVFLFMRRMVEVAGVKQEESGLVPDLVSGSRSGTDERPRHNGHIEVYEIAGPFFFGVADSLQNTILQAARKPHAFVLRMRDVPAIDSTGLSALESFISQCKRNKITLILSEIKERPYKVLVKSGLVEEIGASNIKDTLEAAIAAAETSLPAANSAL